MITILISENEKKMQRVLTRTFEKEGYAVPKVWGKDNDIKIIKKSGIKNIGLLKEIVVELLGSTKVEKGGLLYRSVLENIERPMIEKALECNRGNQIRAARMLGINRNTLRTKIKKFGIAVARWKD